MSKRLECFLDVSGEYLAGKSTTIVQRKQETNTLEGNGEEEINLKALVAVLNSRLLTFWYRVTFRSLGLQGGYMRIGPPQIREVPVKLGSRKRQSDLASKVDLISALFENLKKINKDSNRAGELRDEISSKMEDIERIVYEIYGIDSSEIRAIEDSLAPILTKKSNAGSSELE
jgi:hypothetical protein